MSRGSVISAPRKESRADAHQFTWDAENAPVECVPVRVLRPADSPRLTGADAQHVQLLATTDGVLPPIVVHRCTMRVIDGMHRLHAASMRGHEHIDVRYFDGSEEDAFALGVQLNVGHGLPLTRADRTAAARRIIAEHATWSDRLIAAVSGLSAGTIRSLRRSCEGTGTAAARIGRDGRLRPTDAAAGRLAASRVLMENPSASLRQIARIAGVSLGTARDVRERMQNGEDPLPPMQRSAKSLPVAAPGDDATGSGPADPPPTSTDRLTPRSITAPRQTTTTTTATDDADDQIPEVPEILDILVRDPSLRFTESGRRLLRWLATLSSTLPTWDKVAPTVPSHSAYMVADLARKCAAEWWNFANELSKATDIVA
ncbi:ParB/RepB/Spo0J family partition protein [Actinoplanes sp. N902-109]|uniref:ParB/RepB/Spo0J family partition protein n=1 Tax=Actinoplanes sp. (strain N902-109) TaxID=649831 RepID=UPI0003294560|nr:ParB/RepB/Spo0J family partition protein [Actinoplanes sp. N902-109]AGL15994.1 transcriptional regulator protein [Actinoplanes sp. N902-109]